MSSLARAEVLWNEPLAPGCRRMGLRCAGDYRTARPGQFVMLALEDPGAPLLRRPFSIHRPLRGGRSGIEILYRVVGNVTGRMAGLTAGARLNLLGPLGRGFRLPSGPGRVFIVAGGIGVAPLVFLAETLCRQNPDPERIDVFLGGRTENELLCGDDFRRLGIRVTATTDDGSAGDQCLVTHPVEAALRDRPPEGIYACGPEGMLACVAGLAAAGDVSCQVSVETLMACGMGVCLGCAVARPRGEARYLHACRDGPVFEARLLWPDAAPPPGPDGTDFR